MSIRLFLITGIVVGLGYLALTPPFRVPDESAHFWRGVAVSKGVWLPQWEKPATVHVPDGYRGFGWHMSNLPEGGRNSVEHLRVAREISLDRAKHEPLRYAAIYTPLPYLPQALAAAIGERADAGPFAIFYAARASNLIIALVLIAVAMRVASEMSAIFGAVALLPMSMYLIASWSADAITIALGILFTALALRGRNLVALIVVAFALGLCKPAYFLLAAFLWFTRPSKAWRIGGTVAMLSGTAISMVYMRAGFFNMRKELPVDPDAQWLCILSDPLRFASVIVRDLIANGRFYVEEMIGRFGHNDLILPKPVLLLEALLLIAVAITARANLDRGARIAAVAIFGATLLGILLSQYLIWSVVCGALIEGVQGRYFLPVLAMALAAFGLRKFKAEHAGVAVALVATVCNAMALYTVVTNYW